MNTTHTGGGVLLAAALLALPCQALRHFGRRLQRLAHRRQLLLLLRLPFRLRAQDAGVHHAEIEEVHISGGQEEGDGTGWTKSVD